MNHSTTEITINEIAMMYKRIRHYEDLAARENRQTTPQQEKVDVYLEAIAENHKRIEELTKGIR